MGSFSLNESLISHWHDKEVTVSTLNIVLKTFSAVYFAHPIAQVSVASKPRECGFESHRRLNLLFFYFPYL